MMEAMNEASMRSRNATNKVILNEVHDLKEKIQHSGHMSFLQEPEKKFWEELVDSNIRAGSLACLWCLKAHLNKRLSAAFNKWKLNAALIAFQEKQRKEQEEKKHKPIQDAINVLSKYKDNETSFLSRLAEAENDVQQTQNSNTMSSVKQKPVQQVYATPNAQQNPNNTSLEMMDDETEDFAKLSLTLIDKDIDAETKRRLLLTMSRNILNKTQSLHQQQELSAHKPHTQQSLPSSNNTNSSFFLSPVRDQTGSSSAMGASHSINNNERESWNGYLSRASALDLLNNTTNTNVNPPRPPKPPSAFTFDVPLTHSSGNNSVHSHGQRSHISSNSYHSSGTGTKSLLSPSRNHQSQEELAQILKFRRDAQGQFVKELLSPTSQQRQQQQQQQRLSSSAQSYTRETAENDRYAQILAQATKHLQRKLVHDNNRGRTRQQSTRNQHFSPRDDSYHGDHHSQHSAYSDLRSDFSGSRGSSRSHSRSRSRSASPSAIPGYLQVTRSYLKKTRAGSPPAVNAAAMQHSSPIYAQSSNHQGNSGTRGNSSHPPQPSHPSSSNSNNHYHHSSHSSSSRPPSRGAAPAVSSNSSIGSHSHSHSQPPSRYHRPPATTDKYRSEDEYRQIPAPINDYHTNYSSNQQQAVSTAIDDDTTVHSKTSNLSNRSLSTASHQSSHARKPIHIDTGESMHDKQAGNNINEDRNVPFSPAMVSASALPTPHLYDVNHYPHLDNSPSIKAYLEASLRDFQMKKHPPSHSNNKDQNMTQELSTVAEERGSQQAFQEEEDEAYYGKDLLELSALDDDTFHREEEPTTFSYEQPPPPYEYHLHHHHSVSSHPEQVSRSRVSSSSTAGPSQSSSRHSRPTHPHRSHRDEDDDHYHHHHHHHPDDDSRSLRSHHTQNTHTSQRSLRSTQTSQTQRSSHSGRSHNSKASSAMERAQWKLLYGDLQDVGKKDWERTLRR